MTAILRLESTKHVRASFGLGGVFALLSVFFLAVFPSIQAEAELLEDAMPEYFTTLLGYDQLYTIEGYASGYIYPLIWVLLVGMYFAYVGAGTIAPEIRSRRMDLTLSNPVSRESVVLQKVAALWLPLLILNAAVMALLFGGAIAIGEWLDPVDLLLVHLLGIPYLLVCAALGVCLSVVLDRPDRAQSGAIVLVFALWMLDGLAELEAGFEWLGWLTPSRYYDPTAIMVRGEYALLDAVVLLVAFAGILTVSIAVFVRRDI